VSSAVARRVFPTVAGFVLVAAACARVGLDAAPDGIHKIQHVIVVMQENRSFDNYFGTYPGADGIPMRKNGTPAVCIPDPVLGHCVRPYHDRSVVDDGGPHSAVDAVNDIDGGRMNGFVGAEVAGQGRFCSRRPNDPDCTFTAAGRTPVPDVMGYHTASEIPNYWTYAKDFVLQDHMFEPVASWSLPQHLWMVSGWAADCPTRDPMSCRTAIGFHGAEERLSASTRYPWTDLTSLLHRDGVSWKYYVQPGAQPDCSDDAMFCLPRRQSRGTPGIWNPLPRFEDVHQDGQVGDVVPLHDFYAEAKSGTLPKVSWVVPAQDDSEHPPASVRTGEAHVTGLIDAVMRSPEWDSSAIFLSWDDWGGFYDNVVPPIVDGAGYGLRVPGLVISPYAERARIDHQVLSSDAYLKFIEDDFLGGQRLDPRTDGRPDARPDVRENEPILGNLVADFNFSQPPRPPVLLPKYPTRS
jgi:phospholipase C